MRKKQSILKAIGISILFLCITSFSHSTKQKSDTSFLSEQSPELTTDGLYFAAFYDYIYRGHFENVAIKKEDMEFLMIFDQYLKTYGTTCARFLPQDKVEMQKQICVTENVTTNGYGMEISRTCVEWKWVGSGIYARKELYNAKVTLENTLRTNGLQTFIGMITDPNALGNSVDMTHKVRGLTNDMAQIFRLNDCNGEAIKKFEENLKRYALDQPSIRIDKISKYEAMKKSGGPSGAQNTNKLINDLVADQAKTWSFNRYVGGSISNVSVRKNTQGDLKELNASYTYKGFSGSNRGSVRITCTNGLPECIYFFDFPNNCKTPNSSIVASFASGDYGLD
jgi:hypothetical protein